MLTVEDKVEISQRLALYCHVCDSRELDRLEEIYLPDVTVDRTAYGYEMTYGTDAVRESFGKMPLPPAHLVSAVYVYEEDGVVKSKGKIFFPGPNDEFLVSDVDDVWSRTDDGWRVRTRVFTPRGRLTTFKDSPFTFDK